jgi:hypothetical protein
MIGLKFRARRQGEAATALWIASNEATKTSKAMSPLRSDNAL